MSDSFSVYYSYWLDVAFWMSQYFFDKVLILICHSFHLIIQNLYHIYYYYTIIPYYILIQIHRYSFWNISWVYHRALFCTFTVLLYKLIQRYSLIYFYNILIIRKLKDRFHFDMFSENMDIWNCLTLKFYKQAEELNIM